MKISPNKLTEDQFIDKLVQLIHKYNYKDRAELHILCKRGVEKVIPPTKRELESVSRLKTLLFKPQ